MCENTQSVSFNYSDSVDGNTQSVSFNLSDSPHIDEIEGKKKY